MEKRSVSKLIAAALAVLFILPMAGCIKPRHIATSAVWDGEFCYTVYDDATVAIIAYTGHDEILRLPDEYEGKKVVGFGTKTFEGCEELVEVYLPSSTVSLPAKLFDNCPRLTTVFIPRTVKSIGKNVVFECPEFTTVLYGGTVSAWDLVNVGSVPWTDNYILINAEIKYNQSAN